MKEDIKLVVPNKKRYAGSVNRYNNVIEVKQKLINIQNEDFTGDIYLNDFKKISVPYRLKNGLCIQDTNHKWLEFYDYNSKVKLTARYNEENKIIEWYFDIAREIGKEKGIPYEDDLYLDVVLRPNGKIMLLDEDELKEAFERKEMTKEVYQEAYNIANDLIKKIEGNERNVEEFTDKYLKVILEKK